MMYVRSVLGSFQAESMGQDLVYQELLEQACGSCLAVDKEAQFWIHHCFLSPVFAISEEIWIMTLLECCPKSNTALTSEYH